MSVVADSGCRSMTSSFAFRRIVAEDNNCLLSTSVHNRFLSAVTDMDSPSIDEALDSKDEVTMNQSSVVTSSRTVSEPLESTSVESDVELCQL